MKSYGMIREDYKLYTSSCYKLPDLCIMPCAFHVSLSTNLISKVFNDIYIIHTDLLIVRN